MSIDSQSLRQQLVEHVLGAKGPSQALLEHGVFPANWVAQYLALLEKASSLWKETDAWPRDAVGAIHFASFYFNIRYDAWRHGSGDRNATTERLLGQIRTPSELFLLAGVSRSKLQNCKPEALPEGGSGGCIRTPDATVEPPPVS